MFLLYHVITRLGKEGISMEQDRVRIVDVADALGLSTATVSKVIFANLVGFSKKFSHFFSNFGYYFFCKILYTVIRRAMPSFIMFLW